MDALSNFSYGTVLTAPSPPTSGTSIVLGTGQGAAFPSTPFNAWVWPPSVQPLTSNAEIVRVTNISGDTLTITRAQEGTTARSIAVGWQIAAGLTKKYLDDIEERVRVTTLGWENLPITLTYSSASDPTFIATASADPRDYLSVGMRLKITQGTARYFIITALSATTVTMYGGTDYDLDNAAITATSYSAHKAPKDFPLNPAKWTVEKVDSTDRVQSSPTVNVWYNLGSVSIIIPIGIWVVSWSACIGGFRASATTASFFTTLSTGSSSESDAQFTARVTTEGATGTIGPRIQVGRSKVIVNTSSTTYYLNTKATSTSTNEIQNLNADSPAIIRAVSAYL